VDGWEAKGELLRTLRRPGEAVAAFEALLRHAPAHEGALVTLGSLHRTEGRPDAAVGYWRRAVEVNPWAAEYRKELVTHLIESRAWDEVGPHAQRWLELDPASVEARCAWVQYLLQTGRTADAVAEYGKVRALKPPNLAQLDAWFSRLLR
jgi:tetratricopeptide (TPR) repeat protein